VTREEKVLRARVARLVVEQLRRMHQLEEQASVILELRVKNERLKRAMKQVRRLAREAKKDLDATDRRVA